MLALLAAAALQSPALPPAFEPMAFLVGHCWEGKFDSGETDTHCFDAIYNDQHIRDRHEVKGGKGVYRGETIYSREGKSVSYTYWNSLGGVSRGTMKGEGNRLDFGTEHHRTREGKDIAIVTHWQRDAVADAYLAVTSSPQLPSMNRTVVYRRVDPRGCREIAGGTGGVHPIRTLCPQLIIAPPDDGALTSRQFQAKDGSWTVVHEMILAASPDDVWLAISTAEGWKQWAVPAAWLDGDRLETSYTASAARGDGTTIIQQIILAVPERLLAFRTVKVPKGFPNSQRSDASPM